MKTYLKYWDCVLNYWVKNGSMPPCESYWLSHTPKGLLYPELMPEPYIGDPNNSSLVIMNYNPGAPQYNLSIPAGRAAYQSEPVHHSNISKSPWLKNYASNYQNSVKAGGLYWDKKYSFLGSDPRIKAGQDWWAHRLQWVEEIISNLNKYIASELNPVPYKPPFAIELCGWHSHSWGGIKYNKNLFTALNGQHLASAIEEAILNSDLGIGLCIGKAWSKKILPAFGYKDVTAQVMGIPNYSHGWKPLNGQRNYCILWKAKNPKNNIGKDTYIINTWLSTGYRKMDVPAPQYRPIEINIIKRIIP